MSRRFLAMLVPIVLLGGLLACASSAPAPGRSAITGTVHALPREGADAQAGGGGYGDRRLRNATLVDYDRPGFAVVYIDGRPAEATGEDTHVRLTIRDGSLGPRIGPTQAAIPVGAAVRITNASAQSHIVSAPTSGFVAEIAPRGELAIELAEPGPHRLFLLDAQDAESLVFVAPGPFAVVNRSGRFELDDLDPGTHLLSAWHPRLPPSSMNVRLDPDSITTIDLTMGVGHSVTAGDESTTGEPAP